MKNTFLKIGCLLIAIILAMSTLVACFGGDEGDDSQGASQGDNGSQGGTNGGDVTTEAAEVPPVPDTDWGGREFSVLSVKDPIEPNFEIVGDSNATNVPYAVYQRNLEIQEKYNVNIEEYGDANQDSLDILARQIDSEDTDYDLVFLYRDDMATAIVSGYMKDLTKVEYLNFSNEWYNQSTLESMKISGKLYHMVSDFSLIDKARTNVLFVNRELAEDNQIPDIVSLVRTGDWTIDKMYTYEAMVAADDGDSLMTFDDTWGLACGGDEVVSTFWNALGNELVTVNADGTWTVNLTSEHSKLSIVETQKAFDANISFTGNAFYDFSDAHNVFVDERCLFISETLSAIVKISPDADFSFTAIPYPKYNTAQAQYYTTNDNTYCATYGIPVCAGDASFSGFMVEVLSWKSHTTTFPEYYNVVCKVQNAYDTECAEMVDFVFDGLVFDFGLLYSKNLGGIRGLLQKSIFTGADITGSYAGKEEQIVGKIEMIFEAIELNESLGQ